MNDRNRLRTLVPSLCQPPPLFALYFDLSASRAYMYIYIYTWFSTPPFLWNTAKNTTFLFYVWTFGEQYREVYRATYD